MGNAYLCIWGGGRRKSLVAVKFLEVRLGANADRNWPACGDGALHQLLGEPGTAVFRRHQHPADAGLIVLDTWRNDSTVRRDVGVGDSPQVPALHIDSIGVEVEAALLNHEHAFPHADDGIQLHSGQFVEATTVPDEIHRAQVPWDARAQFAIRVMPLRSHANRAAANALRATVHVV